MLACSTQVKKCLNFLNWTVWTEIEVQMIVAAPIQIIWLIDLLRTSPHPALATSGCSNPIQDTGTCLPCCQWFRPILHPGHGLTVHPSPSTMLCYYTSFIADWKVVFSDCSLNVALDVVQHILWSCNVVAWLFSQFFGLYWHGWMHLLSVTLDKSIG